jgi:tRNA dimethylallyltransferase
MKIKEKPKLIVILGQTSTGKSDFAVTLAKQLKKENGAVEIISADSRQVYKGLDLLSGKITKKEMGGVPHHLLDVVLPRTTFSVAKFQKAAARAIKNISAGGAVPFLVGGTGLYLDAVTSGVVLPEVAPNPKLRAALQKQSVEILFKKLQKLDPARSETIDRNNPVRLIRAIEIATALGKVPPVTPQNSPYDVLTIGLVLPDETLKKRIQERLLRRMKQGLLREAATLHTSGISWKRMYELGLECRYAALHLQGRITKKEMVEQLEGAIWQYAKRQKTWFKRDAKIIWLKPTEISKALKLSTTFLEK